ncbi:hypothetical protein ACH9L7_03500 [Haloferax sp. S1W]|uniref:hypothetical protein n=1 Tax=Haloferax sp. S1W TaxID=3377110 RepID=UPI0037C7005B
MGRDEILVTRNSRVRIADSHLSDVFVKTILGPSEVHVTNNTIDRARLGHIPDEDDIGAQSD